MIFLFTNNSLLIIVGELSFPLSPFSPCKKYMFHIQQLFPALAEIINSLVSNICEVLVVISRTSCNHVLNSSIDDADE